jgi:hypothetical protein
MPQGLSLHIGLNGVDASKYNGWDGTLAGCVNDANAMQAIAVSQGFTPTQLITQAATADAILSQIGQAAHVLESGDTFIISYSGHGGQVPDATGESPTGLDDTWVAYDRMICGHELYNLWSQFAPDVRIEVYSDSCHSGTVIRDLVLGNSPFAPPTSNGKRSVPEKRLNLAAKNFATVFGAAPSKLTQQRAGPPDPNAPKRRFIPPQIAMAVYNQNRTFYEAVQWSRKRSEPTATVILISGCQDNQTSADGANNGLFTEKLLAVWNNAAFQGTLPQFHQAIVALMPDDQTPNYFSVGPEDDTFTASRPLTIVNYVPVTPDTTLTSTPTSTTQPNADVLPSVTGPAGMVDPFGDAPTFTVNLGSNPYYVFEIASDPTLFGNDTGRNDANWYASWADPDAVARMTDTNYVLPNTAWSRLHENDKLYYRVGTTSSSSPNAWDNYMVSVNDDDAPTKAPSFALTSGRSAPPSTSSTTGDVPFSSWVGNY